MNPFHKKSTLEKVAPPIEKMVGPLIDRAPRVLASGLTAAGTFIGVSLASAVVSRTRQRQGSK